MNKLILTALLLLCNWVNLIGQESFSDEEEEFRVKFYSNETYKKAYQMAPKEFLQKRKLYKKAAQEFEKEKLWEAFLFAKTNEIRTFKEQKDSTKVGKILRQSISMIREKAPRYYPKCSSLYHQVAYYFSRVRNIEKAIAAVESGEKLFALGYAKYDRVNEFGSVYIGIAISFAMQGQLDKTQKYLHKAEALIEQSARMGKCLNCTEAITATFFNLGMVYSELGQLERSIEYQEKGLNRKIKTFGIDNSDLAGDYFSLGVSYRRLEEMETCEGYFKKAIARGEKADSNNIWLYNQILPASFNALAETYQVIGKTNEALKLSNRAYEFMEGKSDPAGIKTQALLRLGTIYSELNEFKVVDSLIRKIEESLIENEKSFTNGEMNPEGFHNNNVRYDYLVGGIHLAKEEFDQAIIGYKSSLERIKTSHFPDLLFEAIINRSIADVFEKKANVDSAFYYNRNAMQAVFPLAQFDKHSLPNSSQASTMNEVYQILAKESEYQKGFAATSPSSAKKSALKLAITAIDLADSIHVKNLKSINVLRANLSTALIESSILPYREGIAASKALFDITQSMDDLEKGFYFIQKMKAQNLWLSQLNSNASSKIGKELLKKEQSLQNQIANFEKTIFEARQANDSALVAKYENEDLFNAKNEYLELQRQLELKDPEYFNSKYSFVPEDSKSLQNILAADELIIEYGLIKNDVYAFTISANQPLKIAQIPLDSNALKRISVYNSLLQNASVMSKPKRQEFIELSHELYRQFLQPIDNQLVGKSRLVIIGDGLTNYIPFETLLANAEMKAFNELDFLIKRHEVSYHYSSTLFAKSRKKELSQNEGLFAFAPIYDSNSSGAVAANFRSDSTLRAVVEDGTFAPLPESEREVKSIFQLFNKKGEKAKNKIALRSEANESSLKENIEKPYRYIHIAGHSFADVINPKFSGIACFEPLFADSTQIAKGNDGTLYTGEIYNISAKADLVTLSSCESGLGKLEKSEGLIGLNRAFIYAGTPNVVFSLWKVYDKVSAKLMVDFYKNTLSGNDYSRSLRAAKLKLLNDKKTANPHFWSPYLLIGR